MTIDITPETVEQMARGCAELGYKTRAATLRALSAALTEYKAETAAAYEVAARAMTNLVTYCPLAMPEQYRHGWLKGATAVSMAVDQAVRALTHADSKAALDRMIAEARADGMREALDAASDYTQRVYGDDWKFLSNPIDRERILSAIPKGTSHE